MLSLDLEGYLELQHAAGFAFRSQRTLLKSFVAFAEAGGDEQVHTDRALDWAVLARLPAQRCLRLQTVRRFALSMRVEDGRYEVPPANAMGRRDNRRPRPRIYTPGEIGRLLHAASGLEPRDSIRPVMYTTLFGLLAATGLRISEALALGIDDVTEDGLVIRRTKFQKSRLVPVHETVRRALDGYLQVRGQLATCDCSFFVSLSGRPPAYTTVNAVFLELARSIGLREGPGQPGHRLHDLRHTFAVRSLEQCRLDRDAATSHMTALSTYLGHVHAKDTYWYLEATPGVMKQIADAGETLFHDGVT